MTEQTIMDLQTRVAKLETQIDRLLSLIEQQYKAMELLRSNQEVTNSRVDILSISVRSNDAYIAGQIDYRSGR